MLKVVGNVFSLLLSSLMGILNVAILTILGLFVLTFAIFTLLMPIFGIFSAFGMNIFILGDHVQIQSILGLSIGLMSGIVLATLTWLSFQGLKKFYDRILKSNWRKNK